MYFFFDVEAMHDFFFVDRTFFNDKGVQRIVQFNYSTAQGDSLFGVSIFANSSIARYRTLFLEFSNLSRKLGFVALVDTILCSSLSQINFFFQKRIREQKEKN